MVSSHGQHARRRGRGGIGRLAGGLVVVAAVVAGAALADRLWLGDDGAATGPDPATTVATGSSPGEAPASTPSPTPAPDALFTIVAAGDVLTHTPVNRDAKTAAGYDFSPLLAPVDPWIQGADLAICHLEVPIAPPGKEPTGYPLFGAPAQIAQDLKDQGWDGCSTASNHSLDRGEAGVGATLDALDAVGLGHAGTARSAAEAAQPQVYEVHVAGQAVRVAQIAAAYGTNGLPVPADAPWSVSLIDTDAMIAEATQARADGADLVVASVHCCVEYVSDPTPEQQQIAAALAASGQVDLVIGHHAHVPQPIARLDGGPGGAGMWVAYGLGNYISNQDSACCSPRTATGLLLSASVRKPADGPARVETVEWTPITGDRTGGHRIYALPDVLGSGGGVGKLSAAQLADRQALVAGVVGTAAQERLTPPTSQGTSVTVVPRTAG